MKRIKGRTKYILSAILTIVMISLICSGAVLDVSGQNIVLTEINELEGENDTTNLRVHSETVREALAEAEIEVGLFDKLDVSLDSPVEKDMEITLKRGVEISIIADGETVVTSSTSKTIGEALTENGYFLNEGDQVSPGVSETIYPQITISIVRVLNESQVREESIPFNTITENDPSMYEGQTKVKADGITGKIKITENVVYNDGVEVSRTEVSRETITEKQDKVVLKGTKKKTATATNTTSKKSAAKSAVTTNNTSGGAGKTANFSYSKKLSMVATAYSAFSKEGGCGKTASGMKAGYGVVAVDPKVIPLGTKLYVEGYGYAVAADTGGAIKGNKIDLCFEKSNKELMAYGRKTITVYILN